MYRAGARRYFDSLGISSYSTDGKELRGLLESVRGLMDRHGDRRGRLWLAEFGWGDHGPRLRLIVGPKGQAPRITQAFEVIGALRRRLRLRGVVYYSWRDAPPYPPQHRDLWGLHTGLLDIHGGLKPAFYAFKNALARLR